MMEILWHMRGAVTIADKFNHNTVLDNIEKMLQKQRKAIVGRDANSLTFGASLSGTFFTPNWLAMVIYEQGHFWLEHGFGGLEVRYDLRSLHGFVFCLVGSLMLFVFSLQGGSIAQSIGFAVLAFGWLYGMNMLLAYARVPALIRRTVHGM